MDVGNAIIGSNQRLECRVFSCPFNSGIGEGECNTPGITLLFKTGQVLSEYPLLKLVPHCPQPEEAMRYAKALKGYSNEVLAANALPDLIIGMSIHARISNALKALGIE